MQAFNRYTQDETKNQTGFKGGDFGRGGRTYTTTSRQSKSGGIDFGYGGMGGCAGIVFACISVGIYVMAERGLSATLDNLKEVEGAVPVATAIRGGGDGLVHASGILEFNDGGLRDQLFGRGFADAVEATRVPEYCQWVEIPEHHRKVSERLKILHSYSTPFRRKS